MINNNKMTKEEKMKELIDKAAVIAEIERRIKEIDETGTYLSPKGVLTNLLCHLNTFETKEVDLEKEIKNYLDKQPIVTRSKGIDYKLVPSPEVIAKYFFELGLKTKGE